ncbi:meiotically up-regulated gene 113-domain-containing protein [Mariannaea sp. PMI_226]|nr:meiotically up-regulated gene 113-domain-containing protein [Mariannaea sp. PMI_226]
MSLSTQVYVWPSSSSALREILGLDGSSSSCCRGTTTKNKPCQNPIAKASGLAVSDLLGKIVTKNSLEAARSLLSSVSQLVMCKKNHQGQSPLWLESSEKKLSLYEPPAAQVKKEMKKEEEENDVKYVLAGLRDKSPEPKTEKISPATPIKRADKSANTSKKSPASVSYKTEPSPKQKLSRSPTQHIFEPYCPPLSNIARNQLIKILIMSPLKPSEKKSSGSVYMFTFPDNYHERTPYIKIGYTQNVQGRMASWEKQCGYKPMVLGTFTAEIYVKVERLVHEQLRNERMREASGCPRCGVKHQEWFNVRSHKAAGLISMWTAWTRQEPYDENGSLKERWVNRLKSVDLSKDNCWEEFVYARDEEEDDDDTWFDASDDTSSFNFEDTDDETET